jgi:exosome complex RNA-binding protein Rrp4
MISRIRDLTDCRIIVADNGRVWVHGDADNMFAARELIQTLVDEGHMNNFEDAVHALEQQRGEN